MAEKSWDNINQSVSNFRPYVVQKIALSVPNEILRNVGDNLDDEERETIKQDEEIVEKLWWNFLMKMLKKNDDL